MKEIKCPKCGEVFQVDETGYNQIARQVRDKEFMKEIERRELELDAKREKEIEVVRLQGKRNALQRLRRRMVKSPQGIGRSQS